MEFQQARERVEADILDALKGDLTGEVGEWVVGLYFWRGEFDVANNPLALRCSEVSISRGLASGFSYMEHDGGLTVCTAAERLMLSYMCDDEEDDISFARETLANELTGAKSGEIEIDMANALLEAGREHHAEDVILDMLLESGYYWECTTCKERNPRVMSKCDSCDNKREH